MSNLLVGHTTPTTARIWTRGERKTKKAELSYRAKGTGAWKTKTGDLEEHRGYVHVFDLDGLTADTEYELDLVFKPAGSLTPTVGSGRFRTAPSGPQGARFLLGSCNWRDFLDPEEAWRGIESLVASLNPRFMVHCGDQIYADLPGQKAEFMNLQHYRGKYQRAWKLKPTARVLAALPHYMMLDDHEIFDNYHVGKLYTWESSAAIAGHALAAYREYQHCHNPQPYDGYYYSFSHGGIEFFALDVRTERYPTEGEMVHADQMAEFKRWLRAHAAAPKLVITSVPFVGEAKGENDKWNADWNTPQREEVIDFLAADPGIQKLGFLTGDMHCSYHATMTIGRADGSTLVVHELMSSPINQFTNRIGAFRESAKTKTKKKTEYEVRLDRSEFYGKHSNVMLIDVTASGRVAWDVYRTKGVEAPPKSALPTPPPPFQL